jgi:hypothetical protein
MCASLTSNRPPARTGNRNRKTLVFRFAASLSTIAEFPDASHSGILMSEIKLPKTR